MRLRTNSNFSNIVDPLELQRQLSIAVSDIVDVINGNIELDLNIKSKTIDVVFSAANTEVAVSHGLKRVPIGYLFAGANAATSIYNTTAPDKRYIYLKSSAIATVQVVIF